MKYLKTLGLAVIAGILLIAATLPRVGINNAFLQSDLDGNQKCINNLGCLNVGNISVSNLTAVNLTALNSYISNLVASNITAQTINVSNLNAVTINSNSVTLLANVELLEVFDMLTNAVLASQFTNRYWMNMAKTNSLGKVNIYATLTPTNDVQLELPTNGFRGGLLSANILARGANRTIFFPTNFAAFNTNDAGFVLKGSRYVLTLTNGNELRFTIQSNGTYSVMTKAFGQGS